MCFLSLNIHRHLPAVLDEFDPDIVVYNAGTDILEGDPLGNLDITPEVCIDLHKSIIERIMLTIASVGFYVGSDGKRQNCVHRGS